MGKARQWTTIKTLWITFLCGLGHVGSSIAIGAIGIALGIGVARLETVESFRGDLAAWAFIIFGFGYFLWGLWKAYKGKTHKHFHLHMDNTEHVHMHEHRHIETVNHEHPHVARQGH